ncbi:N-acetylmuramoyl-L-alanine amidase [bacterium]|nr:N-acetylmuramoyl-L-alanine amidase [bacterium]
MKKNILTPTLFSLLIFLVSLGYSTPIKLPQISRAGQTYVALPTLIDSLGLKGKWELPSLHFTAQTPSGLFSISQDNPYILVGEKFYKQPTEPIFHNDTLWVVPQPLIAMLQKILPLNLDWNSSKSTLNIQETPRLENFKLTLKDDTLSIQGKTRVGDSISYKIDSTSISFTFPYSSSEIPALESFENSDSLLSITTTPFSEYTILKIKLLKEKFTNHHKFKQEKLTSSWKLRTLITLPPKPQKVKETAEDILKSMTPVKKKRIVIDPGHGGKDVGAQGYGFNEKDIVLSTAKHLKKELLKRGYEVLITRENDKFIPLKERPKLASQWKGDLFISLHCNAIDGNKKRKESVKGFKVFILREAESEADKTIARRENKFLQEHDVDSKTEIDPVQWIVLQHQLNLYTKESEKMAEHMVHEFKAKKTLHAHGTGASQAGFFVLVGALMPAALFEIGFISNPDEAKKMSKASFQKKLSTQMVDAIDSFFGYSEQVTKK